MLRLKAPYYHLLEGGESATWDEDGKVLTFNLVENKTYTQEDIDRLIKKEVITAPKKLEPVATSTIPYLAPNSLAAPPAPEREPSSNC